MVANEQYSTHLQCQFRNRTYTLTAQDATLGVSKFQERWKIWKHASTSMLAYSGTGTEKQGPQKVMSTKYS